MKLSFNNTNRDPKVLHVLYDLETTCDDTLTCPGFQKELPMKTSLLEIVTVQMMEVINIIC